MSPRTPYRRADPTFGPKTILDCPLGERHKLLMTVLYDREAHASHELLKAMGLRDPGPGVSNRFNPVATVLRDLRQRWGCGFETRYLGRAYYVRWDGKWTPETVATEAPGPA